MRNDVPVSLTEEFVLNYTALPPELDGWRYYRIEYGGHAQSCFMERPVMLPRYADPYVIEMLIDYWQKPSRKKLHKIVIELEDAWKRRTGYVAE